jgi:uncharacterized protein (TIGR03435 family)
MGLLGRWVVVAVLAAVGAMAGAQQTGAAASTPRPKFEAFEVATIKPVDPDAKAGRFFRVEGVNRFVAVQYNLKLLIAAAFDVSPKAIVGGPGWMESAHYDILGVTPGEVRPTRAEQMTMLRKLLVERFQLTFHREQKVYSIYELSVAKGGPKLKPSTAAPDAPVNVISTVYPDHVLMPGRNATMGDLAAVMQRAVFDRPVVDRTGLTGRYDFDLTWTPDETQFGGDMPVAPSDAPAPPLFVALEQEVGLKMEATRGPVSAFVVDGAQRPSAN